MEFETVSDAVDALVVINHTPISAPSKLPSSHQTDQKPVVNF